MNTIIKTKTSIDMTMNIYKKGLVILGILIGFYQTEIHAQDSSLLVGTWLFSENTSVSNMEPDIKAQMDSIPQMAQGVMNKYRGRTLSFTSNGAFVQRMGNGQEVSGNWQLQGNVLLVSDNNGHSFEQQIGELTTNSLVLITPSSPGLRPFFSTIYYTKI